MAEFKTKNKVKTVTKTAFLDPGRVPKCYDVVVVVVVVIDVRVVVTVFEKCQGFVNMHWIVTKLRIHIRDLILDRSYRLRFFFLIYYFSLFLK